MFFFTCPVTRQFVRIFKQIPCNIGEGETGKKKDLNIAIHAWKGKRGEATVQLLHEAASLCDMEGKKTEESQQVK